MSARPQIKDWQAIAILGLAVAVFFSGILIQHTFLWDDVLAQTYPFRAFAATSLANHEPPLWVHPVFVEEVAWLPLIVLLFHRAMRRPARRQRPGDLSCRHPKWAVADGRSQRSDGRSHDAARGLYTPCTPATPAASPRPLSLIRSPQAKCRIVVDTQASRMTFAEVPSYLPRAYLRGDEGLSRGLESPRRCGGSGIASDPVPIRGASTSSRCGGYSRHASHRNQDAGLARHARSTRGCVRLPTHPNHAIDVLAAR